MGGNRWPQVILTGWPEGRKGRARYGMKWGRARAMKQTIQTRVVAEQANLVKSD